MAESPARRRTNGHPTPEGPELRYRVEWESAEEGIRWADVVHAASVDEALEKSRGRDTWPSNGPNTDFSTFRVVAVSEVSPAAEALHQRNARRRHLNTIVETALSALGKTAPDRSDDEAFEILCDFFARAVVDPGHHPFPFSSQDTETGRLLRPDDQTGVMAQLLTAQLAHHRMRITRDLSE